jgi:hypothetical protein
MAKNKTIHSNPLAQPLRRRPDHQLKAELFETLRHLNRGYGVALSALGCLETKDRLRAPRALPAACLRD